jgi:hypothetical protein
VYLADYLQIMALFLRSSIPAAGCGPDPAGVDILVIFGNLPIAPPPDSRGRRASVIAQRIGAFEIF